MTSVQKEIEQNRKKWGGGGGRKRDLTLTEKIGGRGRKRDLRALSEPANPTKLA